MKEPPFDVVNETSNPSMSAPLIDRMAGAPLPTVVGCPGTVNDVLVSRLKNVPAVVTWLTLGAAPLNEANGCVVVLVIVPPSAMLNSGASLLVTSLLLTALKYGPVNVSNVPGCPTEENIRRSDPPLAVLNAVPPW